MIAQAWNQDLEAGALMVDRPVVSSLTHELLHVAAGVQDVVGEEPIPNRPALPAAGAPSAMNSFPYFRSLQIAPSSVDDCSGVPVANTDAICGRILNGYTCAGTGSFSFDYTESE